MSERIPVLLDTDIGSDIDDALCLAYLLAQPRCELVGITTASGEPERRAQLAHAICQAAGRPELPVHSGLAAPLWGPVRQPHAPQAEVLAASQQTAFPANQAVDFLRQTIRARPGEIVLLSIGPLTHAGLLFRLDPELPRLLRGLVIMGGAFGRPLTGGWPWAEWNIWQDPLAAAIVYDTLAQEGSPNLSVGLDVTTRCRLPADDFRRRLPSGGPWTVVRAAAEVWLRGAQEITFHDPLAGATIFAPDLLTTCSGKISVELTSERLRGATLWEPGAAPNAHRVAVAVDAERFFTHYFSVVGRA